RRRLRNCGSQISCAIAAVALVRFGLSLGLGFGCQPFLVGLHAGFFGSFGFGCRLRFVFRRQSFLVGLGFGFGCQPFLVGLHAGLFGGFGFGCCLRFVFRRQ